MRAPKLVDEYGMRWTLAIFIFFALIPGAHAEYRVFQLVITDSTSGKSRTVVGTLDDLQYSQYHYVKTTETIALADTWMCWKRSDNFQPHCPNPKATGPSANSVPDSTQAPAQR